MELHPHFQQPELFNYVRAHGIEPIGYCPIGSPARPERDRTPDDTVDIEDPVLVAIAEAHGVHPAVVCVKWAVQRGQTPVPFSTKRAKYEANIDAVVSDPLSDEEMAAIAAADKGNRLIKGQVFLWKEGQPWRTCGTWTGASRADQYLGNVLINKGVVPPSNANRSTGAYGPRSGTVRPPRCAG